MRKDRRNDETAYRLQRVSKRTEVIDNVLDRALECSVSKDSRFRRLCHPTLQRMPRR